MPDINLNIDSGPSAYTDERIRDLVASFINAGTDINVTHDDANDVLTVDNPSGYTSEEARDDIAAALQGGGSGITVTSDDAADTITVDVSSLIVDSIDTERLHRTHYIDTDDDGQSIIDSASAGDTVVFKKGKHTPTSAYTTDKPLKVAGESSAFTGSTGDAANISSTVTSFDGTVIEQQGPGEDCLRFTGHSHSVKVQDLVLTWESSIAESDTGHGIASIPPDEGGGTYKKGGLTHTTMSNILVEENDGDHYGLYAVNPQQWYVEQYRVLHGGGLKVIQNHDSINHGNMLIDHFTNILRAGSSAHGISFESKSGLLNLIMMNRPQVNTNLSSNTGQKHIDRNENGGTIDKLAFMGMNMESAQDNSSGIDVDTGSNIYMPSLITNSIPINGTATILNADAIGSTEIRGDRVISNVFEAQDHYELPDSGGTTQNIMEYGNNDILFLTNPAAASTTRFDIRGVDSTIYVRAGGVLSGIISDSGYNTRTGGPNGDGNIAFGSNGARIYLNSSGELVAEDEAGNTTTLT